jgi:hypothetical protein
MSDKLREAIRVLASEDAATIIKPLDEKLMAASENLYSLACEVGKLQAENEALKDKLKLIEYKFKSGNSLAVDRITLTRAEFLGDE